MALEEVGLPYEIVGMDHPNHDLDSPAYRALNPFGQIPVIDDDGLGVGARHPRELARGAPAQGAASKRLREAGQRLERRAAAS